MKNTSVLLTLFPMFYLACSVMYAQENDLQASVSENLMTRIHHASPKDSVVAITKPKKTNKMLLDSLLGQIDSLAPLPHLNLSDHPEAARIDSLWLDEFKDFQSLNSLVLEAVLEDDIPLENELAIDLPTDLLKQRLEALDRKTPFNISYNPSLEKVIHSFLKKRRAALTRIMALSDYYFPMFEKELDRFDIPLEMKYLAIVESALNPRARSRVGATGLWQFMYGTGKMFDLEVSNYVDDRRDPIKATKAACEYLKKLHSLYNDWDLALAAYNSGPGNVNKAIRRSGGYKNYWNIRAYLPRETAGYVPAFQATMYLFEYADAHRFLPEKIELPYFQTDTLHVKSNLSFKQISKVTGISVEKIEFLNPAYKLNIIPKTPAKTYTLTLPVKAAGLFVSNEDLIYEYASLDWKKGEKPLPKLVKSSDRVRYRVRSGDYLGRIAARYGVRVRDIKRWNGLRSNMLRIGQRLTIYPRRMPGSRKSKAG